MRARASGDPSALASFVVSLNLHRRHLTESQRAMVAAKLANLTHGQRSDRAANLPVLPVTQAEAADLLNVPRSAVQRAVKVREEAQPEIAQAVESEPLQGRRTR